MIHKTELRYSYPYNHLFNRNFNYDNLNKLKEKFSKFEKASKYNVIKGPLFLGEKLTILSKNSSIYKLYNSLRVYERYRHCSWASKEIIKKLGDSFLVAGVTSEKRPAILELKVNDFFVGVKFHPEYKSRPGKPHPLFVEFIKKCLDRTIGGGKKDLLESTKVLKDQNTKLIK